MTTAEAAIGLGGIWVLEHRELAAVDRFLGIITRAIDGLGDERPDLVARLRARLAAERVYLGTGEVADVRAAVDVLRGSAQARGLAETLSPLHHVLLGPQDREERSAVAAELGTVAASTGDSVLVLMGALWRTVDQFLTGDPGAERELAELRQRADALRVDAVLYIVELIEVMLAVRAGRLADAETGAERCFTRGREVGDADAVGYYGAQLLGIRWLQGRAEEMLPLAREIAASSTIVPTHRTSGAALAALAADSGGAATEEAWRHLDALSPGIGEVPRSSNWLLTMFCAIEAADLLGDAATAGAAYAVLRPFADLPVLASLAVMCFGSAERALGLAARTLGRLDDAVAHLEAAVEANRRLGNRPLVALSRGDLGTTLLRRRGAADTARGASLVDEAIVALHGMGLTTRADRYAVVRQDPSLAPADLATLRFGGGAWELRSGQERVVVPDGVGMRYLARLVAAPRCDVGADELAGTGGVLRQEVLDDAARRDYKRRIEQLHSELDAADATGEPDRAARAQDELDRLLHQLRTSTGLGGRARTFADDRERARTAVQKAIRRAIARIGESAPTLGRLLAGSVQTGLVCRFDPVAGLPQKWRVEGP